MPRKTHAPRNRQVIEGVGALSRSASYKKSGAWAKKGAWKPVAKKPATKTPKQKTFGKQTRVIKPKAPRFYPADDVSTPLNSNKHNHHPTSLRKTLTPGTIVILLAGRHRGSRVVFLKQLPSGLLLVTGRRSFPSRHIPLVCLSSLYCLCGLAWVHSGSAHTISHLWLLL
jgi:large subunit ribosomal protein L6e